MRTTLAAPSVAVNVAPSSYRHRWPKTMPVSPSLQVRHQLANSYTGGASVEPDRKPFDVK